MRLIGIEPTHAAPEATALSTELQTHLVYHTIKFLDLQGVFIAFFAVVCYDKMQMVFREGKIMKQNRRPQRSGRLSDEQRRLLPVVIIPLIVIILMIIIVVADHAKDKNGAEPTEPTETVASTVEPETMEGETGEPETTEPETTVPEETEPADEFATDTL